jgi:uncharacterized protein YraI
MQRLLPLVSFRLFSTLTVCAFLSASASVFAQARESNPVRTGTVTATTLNIRARPGLFFEVIGTLKEGAPITILEENDGWYRIQVPEEAEAWVSARYLGEDGTITGDDVRVRSGAGVAFTPYHSLKEGETVQPLGPESNGWVRIAVPEDATAWASAEYVRARAPVVPTEDVPDPGETGTAMRPEAPPEEAAAPTEPPAAPTETPTRPSPREDTPPPDESPRVATATDENTIAPAPPGPDEDDGTANTSTTVRVVPRAATPARPTTGADPEVENPPEEPQPSALDVVGLEGADDVAVRMTGLLVSLGKHANEAASHVLLGKRDGQYHPTAYLQSQTLDLTEWEGLRLHVYGEDVPCHWSRPLLKTVGVLRAP